MSNQLPDIHDNPEQYHYDLNNSCSASDCTGLIPVPPQSAEAVAAYNEIVHFGIPELDKDTDFYHIQKNRR